MDLEKLFKTQKKLGNRIVAEKGLEGVDLLDKKILALQVELGELANEWQMFKFWKDNPEPRTVDDAWYVATDSVRKYEDSQHRYYTAEVYKKKSKNPLLEKYVDCLHLILDIGNDYSFDGIKITCDYRDADVTSTFNKMYRWISGFRQSVLHGRIGIKLFTDYEKLCNLFVGLGSQLGFSWQEIEQAYYDKNKINHERQTNGY